MGLICPLSICIMSEWDCQVSKYETVEMSWLFRFLSPIATAGFSLFLVSQRKPAEMVST